MIWILAACTVILPEFNSRKHTQIITICLYILRGTWSAFLSVFESATFTRAPSLAAAGSREGCSGKHKHKNNSDGGQKLSIDSTRVLKTSRSRTYYSSYDAYKKYISIDIILILYAILVVFAGCAASNRDGFIEYRANFVWYMMKNIAAVFDRQVFYL